MRLQDGFLKCHAFTGWVSASGAAKQEIQISACYGIYDSGGAIDFSASAAVGKTGQEAGRPAQNHILPDGFLLPV